MHTKSTPHHPFPHLVAVIIFFTTCSLHAKQALLTTKDGNHSVLLSVQAVACSGNVLQTLIDGDEREIPIISLDGIEGDAEQEAYQDLMLFAQHLELVADAKRAHPGATDDVLHKELTPTISQLPLPSLARLFKHADFYGAPILLPILEAELLQKICHDRVALTEQLGANNNPSWLANLPARAHNGILTQEFIQQHPALFFAVSKNHQTLRGHTTPIHNAHYSPDSTLLVTSSSQDNSSRVWQKINGIWISSTPFEGHTIAGREGHFSPDSSKLITVADDESAYVWQHAGNNQWMLSATLHGHRKTITCAQFSPDGTKIVTASNDNTARVWQQHGNDSWIPSAPLEGHTDSISSAQFSPDSSKVVTTSLDKTVRVWQHTPSHEWVSATPLQGHVGYVQTAQFTPTGCTIITTSEDLTARIWQQKNPHEWACVALLNGHDYYLTSAQFNHDGSKIVTISWDGISQVWDCKNNNVWTPSAPLQSGPGQDLSAQFSPDGSKIVTAGSLDRIIRVWKQNKNQEWVIFALLESRTTLRNNNVQFSPDSSKILFLANDGTALEWDVLDVISHNNTHELQLTLADALPALQSLERLQNHEPSLTKKHQEDAEKESTLAQLIETINLRSSQ